MEPSDAGVPRHEVLLALGSNLGEPLQTLRWAVSRLSTELDSLQVSAVYRTPPEDPDGQSHYLNAVVRGWTTRSPDELLRLARLLEDERGRTRPYPGAPRTLDVDVLFVGDRTVDEPELTVPHPRWAQRGFVLVPLMDVASDWRDPVTGSTVAEVVHSKEWGQRPFPIVVEKGVLLPVETL